MPFRFLGLFPLSLLLISHAASATEVRGLALVTDGDTVIVGGQKVRLAGIDAPETDQLCLNARNKAWNCGLSSLNALVAKTDGAIWSCQLTGKDRYGRSLGTCTVNGEDIGRWMVKSGWALAFVRYSRVYEKQEQEAKAARSALWAGAFIAPWDWRRRDCSTEVYSLSAVSIEGHRLLCGSPSLPPSSACTIKGNLTAKGCIYHLPTGQHYGRLNMEDPKKRWFCSEAEAQSAACRRSKR